MSSVATALTVAGLVSAAGLIVILIRRAGGKTGAPIRPLLAGVLFMNGIGLVIILAPRLSGTSSSPFFGTLQEGGLSMAADTAILVLKFGWLFAFLTFLRRFALPLGKRLFRRLTAAVILPVVMLVAGGWAEFLLTSHRDLFDKLQYVSDYFVFFAMIGAGLYLRRRTAVLVSREAAKAILGLAGFAVSIFLLLGLWWIIGGSVRHVAPGLWAAFNPLIFLVFNGGLVLWVLWFSNVLTGPEMARYVPCRISESLSSRLGISRREREIIELVGQGLSNQEIAGRLFISLYTVKKHLNNIFLKTGVGNRVQLVRMFSDSPGAPAAESNAGPQGRS